MKKRMFVPEQPSAEPSTQARECVKSGCIGLSMGAAVALIGFACTGDARWFFAIPALGLILAGGLGEPLLLRWERRCAIWTRDSVSLPPKNGRHEV